MIILFTLTLIPIIQKVGYCNKKNIYIVEESKKKKKEWRQIKFADWEWDVVIIYHLYKGKNYFTNIIVHIVAALGILF